MEYKGLVDQMLAIGWGVLADIPDRLFTAGAVTKPWEADVQFQPLPPDRFEQFDQPGYVKIVWTLEADELPSRQESITRTRIRVKTTDPSARRRFRRYWAILSPGIIIAHGSAPIPGGSIPETVGGVTHTWTDYTNAGGSEGPSIQTGETVGIACKVQGFRVADGDTWWYRIASSPWNNVYYASADAFYNNGQTSGSLIGTPFVDNNVANCCLTSS